MKRTAILLLLPLCVAAAPADPAQHGQGGHKPHRHPRTSARAVRPPGSLPLQQARRTDGFDPAPVPNQNVSEPITREDQSTHVAPTLFHLNNDYHGDGYVYGSSPQGMDDKRALTIPGVKLSVPVK